MKCFALKKPIASKPRPRPPLRRTCTFRLERSARTGDLTVLSAVGMRKIRSLDRVAQERTPRVALYSPAGVTSRCPCSNALARLSVEVVERLEAGDQAEPAPEDLVGARGVADVIRVLRAVTRDRSAPWCRHGGNARCECRPAAR